jgi:hypothetical protein
MAKSSATRNDPKKSINYNAEDMSETEDYFKKPPQTNTDNENSSSNRLEPQNNEKADDGLTIGVLPVETGEFKEDFDDVLSETIDETLSALGEPVKNAIYFHLQNNFNMSKNEIPKKIDEFSDILQKIFGSGACRLEIKFMKTLHSKINVTVKWPEYEAPLSKWIVMDMSFIEYVNSMRHNYEANAKKMLTITEKTF